jgi:hypothetical protein
MASFSWHSSLEIDFKPNACVGSCLGAAILVDKPAIKVHNGAFYNGTI